MAVLSAVWLVIKILLIIVGGVVGLAALLLAALLFCAVSWKVKAVKAGGTSVELRARWLVVTARYVYEGGAGVFQARALGIKVLDSGKDKRQLRVKSEELRVKDGEAGADAPRDKESGKARDKEKERKPLTERVSGQWKKVSGVLGNEDNGEIARLALWLVKKWLRALRPRRLVVRGTVGLDDPSKTGPLVGFIDGLALMKGWDVTVNGDFENERMEGEVCGGGRVRLFRLAFPLVEFGIKRPVRGLLLKR